MIWNKPLLIATKLVKAASFITDKLSKSGLFAKVGVAMKLKNFPELMAHVTDSLPLLFSAQQLEKEIKPLVDSEKIKEALAQNRQALEQLEGIGRSEIDRQRPAGIFRHNPAAVIRFASFQQSTIYQGQLISEDGKRALIIAKNCRIGHGYINCC